MVSILKSSVSRAMATYQTKIEDIIECPVCYRLPRDLPIPSCAGGHIVCQQCREKMSNCPTCRRPINCTNTLIGYIANISSHKCSFFVFGCKEKFNMIEVKQHEKVCPERTIKCPYRECRKDIQLKEFRHHAFVEECAIDLNRVREYDCFENPRNQF